jgi:hypothetical protein
LFQAQALRAPSARPSSTRAASSRRAPSASRACPRCSLDGSEAGSLRRPSRASMSRRLRCRVRGVVPDPENHHDEIAQNRDRHAAAISSPKGWTALRRSTPQAYPGFRRAREVPLSPSRHTGMRGQRIRWALLAVVAGACAAGLYLHLRGDASGEPVSGGSTRRALPDVGRRRTSSGSHRGGAAGSCPGQRMRRADIRQIAIRQAATPKIRRAATCTRSVAPSNPKAACRTSCTVW